MAQRMKRRNVSANSKVPTAKKMDPAPTQQSSVAEIKDWYTKNHRDIENYAAAMEGARGLRDVTKTSTTTITVSAFSTNGTKGENYTKNTQASENEFSYSEGTLTLPKVENATFIIKFERKVKDGEGAKIVNRGDKFPSTVKLTLKALVVDPCEVDVLRAAYIVIPSFQVSPELEISLTTDGQLQYSGSMQMDYCSTDKSLYEIYYADDDANKEA